MDLDENFSAIRLFLINNFRAIFDILLIVIIAWIAIRFIGIIRKKVEQDVIEKRVEADQKARLRTLLQAVLTTLKILVIALALLMALLALGIDITPILASAGIAGLAVSLGAQTLIKDYFGGIIILFENQYNVGDVIEVGNMVGTVERIELRATYVRDIQGKLITIPNGDVRTLANNSRDWSRALVDLNIAFDADILQVIDTLQTALRQAYNDEELKAILLEEPKIQGWTGLSDWAIQVRISAKALPNQQFQSAAILRKYALRALQQAGISLATPTLLKA